MQLVRNYRDRLALVAALLAPLALAGLLVPFREAFANTAAALVFVAVIAAVAVAGNRFTGVVASLSSALWFDFFLTQPYQRLAISHRPDIETTIAILSVGIVVTELAARSRHHLHAASQESDYVLMIHSFTELAASLASDSLIVDRASEALIELLALRACHFEAGKPGRRTARIQPDGSVVHAGIHWPVHEIGIPGPEAEILVQWRGRVLGRFALSPTPGLPIALERRVVAGSLAAMVGAALSDHRQVAQATEIH